MCLLDFTILHHLSSAYYLISNTTIQLIKDGELCSNRQGFSQQYLIYSVLNEVNVYSTSFRDVALLMMYKKNITAILLPKSKLFNYPN